MAFTHTITARHAGGTTPIEQAVEISAGGEENVSEAITDGTTDGLIAFSCDFSQLKMLTILSNVAITICTNAASSGAPDQTIDIAAGVPYQWVYGSGITCPITTDITALYVTNSSGSTSNLEIRALEDITV